MTPLILIAVAAAGGLGAAVRLVVDGAVRSVVGVRLPWGTLAINVTGSFLLGLLTALVRVGLMPAEWEIVLGTGVLGGYTTFSTASVETVRLLQEGRAAAALLNGLGGLVVAVASAFAGYELGVFL